MSTHNTLIPPQDAIQPWDKIDGETEKAWSAFQLYRDVIDGSRALSKVAAALSCSRQNARSLRPGASWQRQ